MLIPTRNPNQDLQRRLYDVKRPIQDIFLLIPTPTQTNEFNMTSTTSNVPPIIFFRTMQLLQGNAY